MKASGDPILQLAEKIQRYKADGTDKARVAFCCEFCPGASRGPKASSRKRQ